MTNAFVNCFKIPELRTKILFTFGMIFIARVGANIPLPGIDPRPLQRFFEEAADAGLVHYAVEPDQVLEKSLELAREIASSAPLAVRWTKKSIYNGLNWDPAKAAEYEAHVQSRTMETEDFREGISALLSRREPKFQGK